MKNKLKKHGHLAGDGGDIMNHCSLICLLIQDPNKNEKRRISFK